MQKKYFDMEGYRICSRCVMDTSDKDIEFDENGICTYCKEYEVNVVKRSFPVEEAKIKFDELIKKIKNDGKNRKYDCVVGISGGVDSTYVAYLAKKEGLRPLAVHMDNGWNTKKATKNIFKILKKLDIDLYTYVIDWEEFKDLQLSYFKASVIDMEALTDHAIKAVMYKTASDNNIKYILTGINIATEGGIPPSWRYNKNDYFNIKDIHSKFGKVKMKTFPILSLQDRFVYQIVKDIKMVEILNYVNYNKEEVKLFLKEEFGWEDYGNKHGESMFTHFFQEYILPVKFNIDKRKPHLSSLVRSGQMSRQEALEELKKPLYNDEDLKNDKNYVLNKFGLNEKEFEVIMNSPVKSHYDYKSSDKVLRNIRKIYQSIVKR